jgi:hypothetical protein
LETLFLQREEHLFDGNAKGQVHVKEILEHLNNLFYVINIIMEEENFVMIVQGEMDIIAIYGQII